MSRYVMTALLIADEMYPLPNLPQIGPRTIPSTPQWPKLFSPFIEEHAPKSRLWS